MDWKILLIVIGILGIFFTYQKCVEEKTPSWNEYNQKKQKIKKAEIKKAKIPQRVENEKISKETAPSVELPGKRPEPKIAVLETKDFRAEFTTQGASLFSYTLKNIQYIEPPRDWNTGMRNEDAGQYVPVNLVTTKSDEFELNNPLRFTLFSGLEKMIKQNDWKIIEKTDKKIVFRYEQPGLNAVLLKKFEIAGPNEPFQFFITVKVKNTGEEKLTFLAGVTQVGYQHESETEGGWFSKQPNIQNGICKHGDSVVRYQWNADEIKDNGYSGLRAEFAGIETNYFVSAMIPVDDLPTTCLVKTNGAYSYNKSTPIVTSTIRWGETNLNKGESQTFKIKNFMGPKKFKLLQSVGNSLEESVDFGWFSIICHVLLYLLLAFQQVVGNWGMAIILLTVLVKLVLMPLTHRSFKSSEQMKNLKPQMDKLNEQYKDNPQEKQKAIMSLYKKNGVNPMGGCLPMLLQMPIWIALFRTLRASPELYRAPFFGWIQDLSSPDPYFITPIVMGALMFLQQKYTPMTGDSAQAKMMMYFMPIMFTAMMLFLPSGLTLYILVNTVLSIAHQMMIHRNTQKESAA